ncbi:MAG: hypothetical protein IT266_02615 [Saprospiraceae bacterium]|nr:hypothetical protein [Saprospiraceae bacterium]
MVLTDFPPIETFRSLFGRGPLMVVRAPGRMNLLGEHTDYNGGWCLPAAIQRSIYIGLVPSAETSVWSVDEGNAWCPGQRRDRPSWAIYFEGAMEYLREKGLSWPAFRLAFGGDLPAGAGLSSSSAITCGLVALLDYYASWEFTPEQCAALAVEAERRAGVAGGMMDQLCIFHARKDMAMLLDCTKVSYNYLPAVIPGYGWFIADTRVRHHLPESDYNKRSFACREILDRALELFPGIPSLSALDAGQMQDLCAVLRPPHKEYALYVFQENARVLEMASACRDGNALKAGGLLFAGHEGLRRQYRVSCDEADFLVNYARHSEPALGARIMGAGFGGCTLHLLNRQHLDEYAAGITNAFKNRFGWEPRVFEAIPSDGIERIH